MVSGVIAAGPAALPTVAAAVGGLMLLTWLASVILSDVSVADVAWGPAFVLVALVEAMAADGDPARRRLLLALTATWGLRLGLHLLLRKLRERGEDRRYRRMRRARRRNFALRSLVVVFALQGVLIVVVSLPLQVGAGRSGGLSSSIAPGLALYVVGVVFEAVGDEQLRRFKRRGGSDGRVLDSGLWRFTRHPNYFGDACVWWGLWLVVLPAGGTWWTAIGPLVMTVLLVRVSGKGLLERDIGDRRPAYVEYVRRTSGFVPLPPRSRHGRGRGAIR